MKPLTIILIAILALIIIGTICYLILTKVKDKWLNEIYEDLQKAIQEAEDKYQSGEGQQKRVYVLHTIKQKCEELKIPFNVMKSLLNVMINKIIEYYNILAKRK